MAAGVSGEDFARRIEAHRRELNVHCYRMLASFDEAEDAGAETLLRPGRGPDACREPMPPAWRAGDEFAGTALRAWLYRIATNVCLDAIRSRSRRAPGAR